MPRENNFLLGRGERLTAAVEVPSGGGPKNPPYDFISARARIADKVTTVKAKFDLLPSDACPNDEVVAVLTMHPRYVAKSDYPSALLSAVGLRSIGSRSRTIRPENWEIKNHPDHAVTEDIFVAGKRRAFDDWPTEIRRWTAGTPLATELVHVEDVAVFDASSKLKTIPEPGRLAVLEIVLHNSGRRIVEQFVEFALTHSAELFLSRRRDVQGLTFIPVRMDTAHLEELAQFSFIRVARGMPSLRPYQPTILRVASGFGVQLPDRPAVDEQSRAAIFDGGIPTSARSALSPWVTLTEPAGVGPAVPEYEQHGLAVTSAFLFGPLSSGVNAPTPICAVDHIRIVDAVDATGRS